jgi:hypothetical protein
MAMQLFQVLRLTASVGSGILLAKSDLSLGDLGVYETQVYLGSFAVFLGVNGLLQAMTPIYSRLPDHEKPALLTASVGVFAMIGALLAGSLYAGATILVPLLTGLPIVPHLGWFCMWLFLNTAVLPVEIIYLLRQEPRHIIGWGVVSFGLHLVALAAPVWTGYGLEGSWQALAALGLVRACWMSGLLARYGGTAHFWSVSRAFLWFGMPLVANTLVGSAILLFDNWLVGQYYRSDAVFALYRYGSREFPLALALATALGMAMVPLLSTDLSAGLAELKRRTRRLMHVVFPVALLLMLSVHWWFPLVFNADLAAAARLFKIYLLLTATRVLLPNAIVLGLGKPAILLYVGLAELCLKVATGWLGLYFGDLEGLAWSAIGCFAFEKIALMLYLAQRIKIRTTEWLDIWWYAGYVAALVLGYWYTY